jgi:hypothetical protein
VVRNPKMSFVVSPSLTFLTDCPARADPGEAGERPGLIERESDRRLAAVRQRLVLAKTRERHDAAMLDAEPASPVRGFDVPDIGDARIRVAPFQQERRRGHAPTRHRKFPTFRLVADNGCPIVRKYPRQRGQVTRSVAHGAGQITDCLLAFCQRIKIAQIPIPIIVTCRASWRRRPRVPAFRLVGLARDVFAPMQNASYGPAHHLKHFVMFVAGVSGRRFPPKHRAPTI